MAQLETLLGALAVGAALLTPGSTQAMEGNGKDQTVTLSFHIGPIGQEYVMFNWDYVNSKLASGPAVVKVARVPKNTGPILSLEPTPPPIMVKAHIMANKTLGSFGGHIKSDSGDWSRKSDPDLFVNVLCGSLVGTAPPEIELAVVDHQKKPEHFKWKFDFKHIKKVTTVGDYAKLSAKYCKK